MTYLRIFDHLGSKIVDVTDVSEQTVDEIERWFDRAPDNDIAVLNFSNQRVRLQKRYIARIEVNP